MSQDINVLISQKDENGNYKYFYPFTYAENVLMDDGTDITDTISDIYADIYDKMSYLESIKEGKIYGMRIDGNESDPSNMITYLADAARMVPAYMDYNTGKFNYGSWGDVLKDIKPVVLNSDGTVYCYIDKDDFTKDVNGNDISNIINGTNDFNQNVMVEFSKFWIKIIPFNNGKSAYVYIADYQVNKTYKDYAYIDYTGNHKDNFYMPCYNGSLINNVMRSLSGKQVSGKLSGGGEINACTANGNGWYTEDAGEVMLINFLLMLIGKSTDTQTVFGQGLHSGGSDNTIKAFRTGVHNDKGMFYGTNSGATTSTYTNAVKIFGIENWWGFQWRRYAGDINDKGTRKIKLCWGTEDGSTETNFNTTGAGYIDIGATPSGNDSGYISEMKFTENGMYSKVSSGSSSTYYCDGQWFNNSQVEYALRGGSAEYGLHVGALFVGLYYTFSSSGWNRGVAISYK